MIKDDVQFVKKKEVTRKYSHAVLLILHWGFKLQT